MINFDDKRGFYRMLLNSEVKITIIDDEVNTDALATCRDLSATGMALEMSHPIEIGTRVRVSVDSASGSVQALDAKGKIVRVKEEGPDCYLLGVEINELT
ncbi:MAG: PilZ domain-containing protein [Thalassotalea sp.]